MDFVLVLGNLLGHRDLATGLVVDLRRKRTERVRESTGMQAFGGRCSDSS